MNIRSLYEKEALTSIRLAGPVETFQLGRAFAKALTKDWNNESSVRKLDKLALIAMSGRGKSTLVKGIVSTFQRPCALEIKKGEESRHDQTLWSTLEHGLVRHVDLGFGTYKYTAMLRAYRFSYLEKNGYGGLDILENADTYSGEDPEGFDAAIKLAYHIDPQHGRCMMAYIHATQEFAARPQVQEFLDKTSESDGCVSGYNLSFEPDKLALS